jgi:peptide/nickel transport system ATP-binding protein
VAAPSAEPLLRVSNLTIIFSLDHDREQVVVDDVSFAVAQGETLGLVGESGSGKSLTALSIVRLVMPPGRIAAGRVELEGRDLLTLDAKAMQRVRGRKIGFVFQEPSAALNPVFTIGFQVAETMTVHGLARGRAARERAVALLDRVGMPEPQRRAREYPHQLSGGLKQRAMIALALAAEPVLLIADEPTTALDARVQADILDLLRELRQSMALSVLLISHDFGVIAELADRVIVMKSGRMVEEAPIDRIFTAAHSPYTQQLLDAAGAWRAGRPGDPC